MKKSLLTLLFSGFALILKSQISGFENDYSPLISKGELPDLFISSAITKTTRDISKLNKEKIVKYRNKREEFLMKANFSQDKLLRSGRVLFNDEISVFVNKVADEALKHNPQLRKEIQIFVIKSAIANAYCFDNGTILVTTGLVSQIDNEAQLAFILCHEAIHYRKKHSMEKFVTASTHRSRWSTDVEFDEYKYSKENELEADMDGALEFKQSNYSYKGVTGAFNVLKYSRLPFDEVKYNKTFLEDSNLVFPPGFQLTEISPIKADEDYDDSESTHPNIKKRKEAVNNKLGEITETGRLKFIVGQTEFYRIREIARFEQCRIALMNQDYPGCIYNCYLLLQKYPNNIYLKTTLGKALFQVAANKSDVKSGYLTPLKLDLLSKNKNRIAIEYENVLGNSQQVYYLFNRLSAIQSCALALNYNWKLNKSLQTPSPVLSKLCDSLFVLLAVNNNTGPVYFKKQTRKEYIESLKAKVNNVTGENTGSIAARDTLKKTSLLDLEDVENDSKVKRIELEKTKQELEVLTVNNDSIQNAQLENEFEKFAFVDLLKQDDFTAKFRKATQLNDEILKKNIDSKNETEKNKNKGGLGIDRIVILNPFYSQIDGRDSENKIEYVSTEKKLISYTQILKDNAKLAGLDYTFVNSRGLGKADIGEYNDYTLLNDWISEYLNEDANPNMLVLNNDAASMLKEKYKTKYVLWSGVVNVRDKKSFIGSAFFGTFLIYPAVFTLPYLAKKSGTTYYLTALFNLEENKIQFYQTVVKRSADTNDFLNSWVYETMINIKAEPKFKKL